MPSSCRTGCRCLSAAPTRSSRSAWRGSPSSRNGSDRRLVSEHVAFCRACGCKLPTCCRSPRTRDGARGADREHPGRAARSCRYRSPWRTSPPWSAGRRTSSPRRTSSASWSGVRPFCLLLDVANLVHGPGQLRPGPGGHPGPPAALRGRLRSRGRRRPARRHLARHSRPPGHGRDPRHPRRPRRPVAPPGVLLERDDAYPSDAELAAELSAIRKVLTECPRRLTHPAAWPARR